MEAETNWAAIYQLLTTGPGYYVLRSALAPDLVAEARRHILAHAEETRWEPSWIGRRKRVTELLEFDPVFIRMKEEVSDQIVYFASVKANYKETARLEEHILLNLLLHNISVYPLIFLLLPLFSLSLSSPLPVGVGVEVRDVTVGWFKSTIVLLSG